LQAGALRCEVLVCADFFLEFIEPFVHEFDEITALEADQVVMVGFSEGLLIPGALLCEPVFGDEAAFLKKIEGIVDGSPGNLLSARYQPIVKIFRVEVSLALCDGRKDCQTGRGEAQISLRFQVFLKDIESRFCIHRIALFGISLIKNKLFGGRCQQENLKEFPCVFT
jgi:hypothetical protein